jgi:hypothetical protein
VEAASHVKAEPKEVLVRRMESRKWVALLLVFTSSNLPLSQRDQRLENREFGLYSTKKSINDGEGNLHFHRSILFIVWFFLL